MEPEFAHAIDTPVVAQLLPTSTANQSIRVRIHGRCGSPRGRF
jgi:hypothetical protein